MFRAWCEVYGHEVLIPGYQVHGVERRHGGDVITFQCACGRDATLERGSHSSAHLPTAERLPLAV